MKVIVTDFSTMSRRDLEEYMNFMLRQYRLVDALWFLAVEDIFGLDAAVKLNEGIWEDMASRSAKEITRRFNIQGQGLHTVIQALRYFPWTIITRYEIEESEHVATVRVPKCPPQEARLRSGRDIFPCKTMHQRHFQCFAKTIDERVKVECVFAPPDPHPPNIWCEWKFTFEKRKSEK
jgi:hypothetical protein